MRREQFRERFSHIKNSILRKKTLVETPQQETIIDSVTPDETSNVESWVKIPTAETTPSKKIAEKTIFPQKPKERPTPVEIAIFPKPEKVLPSPKPAIVPKQTELPHTEEQQKSKNLPTAFEAVENIGETFLVGNHVLPWLSNEQEIPLVRVRLAGTGQVFHFGSAIRGKRLQDAATALDERRNRVVDQLFYSRIPDLITSGFAHSAKVLENRTTDDPIYYFGNKSGQRVYFMKFNGEQRELPLILRIAVCDKANQSDVLSVLTTQDRKRIKYKGRL
jgi:hypothetical protein